MKSYFSAHTLVHQAIVKGTLVRQPCSRCGASKVEAHHDDYAKPLDVIWLCHKCHRTHHAELNGLGAAIPLRIPRDMVKAIDTYWHRERLPSRSAAIRELLAYALDAKLKPPKEQRR